MKYRSLMIVIAAVLTLSSLACTMSAGVEQTTPAQVGATVEASQSAVVGIAEFASSDQDAAVTGGPDPSLGATYTDPVGGYAIDYPAGWWTLGDPGSALVLQSEAPSGPGGGVMPEGITKIDVIPPMGPGPHPATLEELLAEADSSNTESGGVVIEEQRWLLSGGIPAVWRTYESDRAGQVSALYTIFPAGPISMFGYGDPGMFDQIARTLRPLDVIVITPAATVSPSVIEVPTSAPVSDLGATFTNALFFFAFDYPAGWYLSGEAATVMYLTSFEMSGPGGGGIAGGATKIDILATVGAGMQPDTLDALIAYVDEQNAREGIVASEEERWELPGGIPAIRRIYDDIPQAGRVAALYAVINYVPVRMLGYGDLTRFDEIARTVRPVPKVIP